MSPARFKDYADNHAAFAEKRVKDFINGFVLGGPNWSGDLQDFLTDAISDRDREWTDAYLTGLNAMGGDCMTPKEMEDMLKANEEGHEAYLSRVADQLDDFGSKMKRGKL